MNRFLVPAALAALLANCVRPSAPNPEADQSYYSDSYPLASETTVVVREIHHEAPVVYVDTVYYEEEPLLAETVYVGETYEYETYVYVSDPPPPHHRHPGWSPRGGERHPSRPPRNGKQPREREPQVPQRDRDKPRPPERKPVPGPQPWKAIEPAHPNDPTGAAVINDRQKSPDKPTPPDHSAAPVLRAPAKDDTLVTIPVRNVRPIPADRSREASAAGAGEGS